MKFNFDKIKKAEPEVEISKEITQEDFDAQIEQEASKLKTSIEELAKEIGDPEEFKKKMESHNWRQQSMQDFGSKSKLVEVPDHEQSNNIATAEKNFSLDWIRSKNREAKGKFNLGAAIVAVAVAVDFVLEYMPDNEAFVGLKGLVEKIKDGDSNPVNYAIPIVANLWLVVGAGGIVSAIKSKLSANKEKRNLAKEQLKQKMTGVDLNA